jgi:hypothetical protein
MKFEYVPLLQIQRDLHDLPRDYTRFKQYLHTILKHNRLGIDLPPLVAMNPMGKDHVTHLLDEFLAIDADKIAGAAAGEASKHLLDEPWDIKAGLVISDDLAGGWTNRFACEFGLRFGPDHLRFQSNRKHELPRWLSHFWITGVVWSSESATAESARAAMATAVHRLAYVQRRGPAKTLRDMMRQEGHVMTAAGCSGPTLDADDLDYTREVIQPYLDADDMRTAIECLFGDAAGRTLGFTPRGLSPWAGLALAIHDANMEQNQVEASA